MQGQEAGREGRGIYLPGKQFHLTEELGQMAPMPLSTRGEKNGIFGAGIWSLQSLCYTEHNQDTVSFSISLSCQGQQAQIWKIRINKTR